MNLRDYYKNVKVRIIDNKRRTLDLAELARQADVQYMRIYQFFGIGMDNLDEWEVASIKQVLDEHDTGINPYE